MERTFCLLTAAEVGAEDFDWDVVLESAHSLRWNLAGTKTFVKWEGATPPQFEGKTLKTYEQIMALLLTPAWRAEDSI
tara:strand:- start:490 stop:723 length:234 start_codon:yes stop_codon:yes gene_type:complete